MKKAIPSFLVALPLFLTSGAFGQQQTFKIDPQASQVAFSLGDILHTVKGTFHVQSGIVDFDRSAPKISGSVVVAAGSGKSGNDTRDKKMTKEILDAPRFAEVSFVPQSYRGTLAPAGDSTIQVRGTFTLHGTPHELTLPMWPDRYFVPVR
jgi:polyisoprenoid-binding protein YceI